MTDAKPVSTPLSTSFSCATQPDSTTCDASLCQRDFPFLDETLGISYHFMRNLVSQIKLEVSHVPSSHQSVSKLAN
jgi:hypothetical protein